MPDWLTTIDRAEAYWTAETSDVLGDANTVFVAVRLPTGHELTAIVLVDHNLGTITKDGFVVSGSGPVIIPQIHAKHDVADVTLTEIALAGARRASPTRSNRTLIPTHRPRPRRGRKPGRSSSG